MQKKILIVAPYWQTPNNVSNFRVDRFIRWLKKNGYYVCVLKSGKTNSIQEKEWGTEISKKDYIYIVTNILRPLSSKKILKTFWFVWVSILLIFSPVDEFFIWASSILSNADFQKCFNDIDLIISTSPPHSTHIAAFKISKKYSIPLITDFRDGWLDEPFEQKINKLFLLRKIERRWEKKIIVHSSKIFETSQIWKEMLEKRFLHISNKVIVLTNAYPLFEFSKKNNRSSKFQTNLLYAGRFAGSKSSRDPKFLLKPLYDTIMKEKLNNIEVMIISELRRWEKPLLEKWSKKFTTVNCNLISHPLVSRDNMFKMLEDSDGLLLLSVDEATIPSKLFEYIKSMKPILAVTSENNAVWKLGKEIPQIYLFDYRSAEDDNISNFIHACKTGNYDYKIPAEFSEEYLSRIFLNEINIF